ncbi:MAG: histidine kinase [Ferruginibacter sp.]|nr:histidine kinase [Ferruginibacter sp.]
MFNHRYRYYFVLALSFYTYLSTVFCEVYKYFKIPIEWYYAAGTILLVTLLIWETGRLMEPYFIKKTFFNKSKIRGLVIFFGTNTVTTIITTVFVVMVVSMLLHNFNFAQTIVPLKLILIYALLANLLFHLVNAIFFYFKEYEKKWKEAEKLKRITTQAELQLVKSQINPHFLFNNLNVLSALVMKNNGEANKFIEEFCKVYRYILNNQDKELVNIKTELEFIKPYIFLLEKRFVTGLSISINIPEKYNEKFIIPASLQMLIENAIKHNIATTIKPLHIILEIKELNSLVVSNNLQLRESVENSTEIGLKNIIKRYLLVSGKEVVVSKTTTDFTVSLPLLSLN